MRSVSSSTPSGRTSLKVVAPPRLSAPVSLVSSRMLNMCRFDKYSGICRHSQTAEYPKSSNPALQSHGSFREADSGAERRLGAADFWLVGSGRVRA
jgi:hypothetical protein